MRNLSQHLLFFAALLLLLPAPVVRSAPEAANQSLEDLGDDLLNDGALQELLKRSQGDDAGRSSRPGMDPADIDDLQRMFDPNRQARPSEGEDLGQPSKKESPLVGISQQMQQAGDLIASQNISGETRQVQNAIVSELDKLIDELNKQCKKCSGEKASKPGQQQTQSSTPKPGEGKPGQGKPAASQGTNSSPTDSQVSNGSGGKAQPGSATDAEVIKELWGQLPERLRQQLMQSSADEFLPKYRDDLEAYFRRLSQERSTQTQPSE